MDFIGKNREYPASDVEEGGDQKSDASLAVIPLSHWIPRFDKETDDNQPEESAAGGSTNNKNRERVRETPAVSQSPQTNNEHIYGGDERNASKPESLPALALDTPIDSEQDASNQVPTAWLKVLRGEMPQKRYLIQNDNYVIGRGRDADLQILHPKVSRKHVVLRYASGSWFIQDPGSTSGLLVNGKKVSATRLQSGDEITVIVYKFQFNAE